MAGATITMKARKHKTLQEIHAEIHCVEGAEQISKTEQAVGGVTIWTLAYEKYFFRTGSFTSVTVVLTEYENEQTACIVSSGGGTGMANHSYGANRRFAKECVEKLEGCGFTVVSSDLERKGISERFLK